MANHFDDIIAQYDPDAYADEGSTDTNTDPTLKALSDGNAREFFAYPEDLTTEENPGHFILFQAFEVAGLKISDITNGIVETTDALFPEGIRSLDVETVLDLSGHGDTIATDEAALQNIDNTNTLANRLGQTALNSALPGMSMKQGVLGKRKTLKDTIALYMPNNLSVSYGFDYAMDNTLMASGIRSVVDWMNNPSSEQAGRATIRDVKNFAIETGVRMGAGSLNLFGQDLSGSVSSITRKVLNPHLEFLFKQVNQRAFAYTFNFFPRNNKEVAAVHEIIKKFKFHAHPVYDSKSTFLTMPSEFEIVFYSANKENRYLSRVLPCTLTGIEVNYTPNGQAAFFKHVDPERSQAPVQIEMTLQFGETALLHRDHIEKDY